MKQKDSLETRAEPSLREPAGNINKKNTRNHIMVLSKRIIFVLCDEFENFW